MTDLYRLPTRSKDGHVHVVVETPRGSQVKLKFEPSLGAFLYSRALALGVSYPYDWGFVPSTRAEDGDPLDAMVLLEAPTAPGVVVPCRPIGVVQLDEDAGKGKRERNDRLICAPVGSQRAQEILHHGEMTRALRDELGQFFVSAVFFLDKDVRLLGWKGPKAAERLVDRAARAFAKQ